MESMPELRISGQQDPPDQAATVWTGYESNLSNDDLLDDMEEEDESEYATVDGIKTRQCQKLDVPA